MVVDGERLVGELVGHLNSEEGRAGRDFANECVPEIAGEEESECPVREWKLLRGTRDGAVEALRLEDDPVRVGEAPCELRHLLRRVGLVETERDDPVTLGQATGKTEREPLVPVLFENSRALGNVVVKPQRGRDGAVGARVDAGEREGPHGCAAHDRGAEDAPRAPALGLLREPGRRPQGEKRVDGQEVPRELHLERARQENVGREKRDEDPLDVRELPDEGEAAGRGPQRGHAEQRTETPEHDLPGLVQEVRDADVLVRERQEARVPDHRALFREGPPELVEVQERVGLAQERRDEGGAAAGREEKHPAAPGARRPAGDEHGDGQGKDEGSRAGFRGDRETRQRSGEQGIAETAPSRETTRGGEGEEDEKRERHVRSGEVRSLDVEDGEGEEEPGEETRLRAVEAAAHGGEERDGQRAGEGRQKAADVDDAVVGREPVAARERPQERGEAPGQVERKGAIGEKVRVELKGSKRQLEDRVADCPLVRMEEMILVEIEADDPDGESEQGKKEQESAKRSRRGGSRGSRRSDFA